MESGLLSLKWNNHSSTFFHVLETIRKKELYSDVTIACDGKFFSVHKLVLSTCSEYFQEMFERTQCKHPIIVLKDINCKDLESLLNYMYIGEVNVIQTELSSLIKAAECLKVKGLAVPDEPPPSTKRPLKRSSERDDGLVSKRNRRTSMPTHDTLPVQNVPTMENRTHRVEPPTTSPAMNSEPLRKESSEGEKDQQMGHEDPSASHSYKEFEKVVVKTEKEEEPPDNYVPEEIPPVSKFEYDGSSADGSINSVLDDGNDSSSYGGQLPPPPQPGSEDSSMGHMMPSTSRYGESASWPSDMDRLEEGDKEGGEGSSYDPSAFPFDASQAGKGSHMDNSEEIELVQCPGCPARLSSTAFNAHLRLHMTQHLHCDICGYRTVRRDRLDAHLKTHENPDSSYACPHCPFTSRHKASLCRHLKTHLEHMLLSCPHCHYNTSDSSNYKRHLRTRHGHLQPMDFTDDDVRHHETNEPPF